MGKSRSFFPKNGDGRKDFSLLSLLLIKQLVLLILDY